MRKITKCKNHLPSREVVMRMFINNMDPWEWDFRHYIFQALYGGNGNLKIHYSLLIIKIVFMIFLLLLLPASIQVVLNWIRMMMYVTDTDNIPVKVPRVIWKNPFPLRGPTLSISLMRFSIFCLSNFSSIIRSLSCKGLTNSVMAWYPSSKMHTKSIILQISPKKKQKKPKAREISRENDSIGPISVVIPMKNVKMANIWETPKTYKKYIPNPLPIVK